MTVTVWICFLDVYLTKSMWIIEKNSYSKSVDFTSHLVPHQCICFYNLRCIYDLKLMSGGVRVREPRNVTVLNKIEVKHQQLLIVLFGNPFIDAMESRRKTMNCEIKSELIVHVTSLKFATLQSLFQ